MYCLLSRSRRVSSLPNVNAWEEYMDVSKLSQYDAIPTAEFLQTYDFGAMLREFKGGEGRDFQDRCREFIDRFVELILAQQAASSGFSSSLYCFCPELLLEGDDKHVFDMFNRLARHLERCGVVSDIESKSAVEEFRTFVVDVRGRHAASGEIAENIPDVVSYLLGDYSFLARKNLCRVFELCCLVVLKTKFESCSTLMHASSLIAPKVYEALFIGIGVVSWMAFFIFTGASSCAFCLACSFRSRISSSASMVSSGRKNNCSSSATSVDWRLACIGRIVISSRIFS